MPDHENRSLGKRTVPRQSLEITPRQLTFNGHKRAKGYTDPPQQAVPQALVAGKLDYRGVRVMFLEQLLKGFAVASIRSGQKQGLVLQRMAIH